MTDAPEKKPTALIIDDEIHMRRMLQVCLERNGYDVRGAATGDDGINQAIQCQPDIILLDLGLPDMDGLDVLKYLREWSQVPIVVVSVRDIDDEIIFALDKGANDYITKPFSTGQLLARMRAVRRHGQLQRPAEIFKSGDLKVDLTTRSVKVRDHTVKMTATEYSLLVVFVKNAGKVLTHGYLIREIWGSGDLSRTGVLRVYIRYLREKLEADPAEPQLLISETGVGYRLVVPD
jgi:two-component system, OmpR family, KDP operon response regulator KdpE